jgi:hypothetical protein
MISKVIIVLFLSERYVRILAINDLTKSFSMTLFISLEKKDPLVHILNTQNNLLKQRFKQNLAFAFSQAITCQANMGSKDQFSTIF